MFVIFKNCAALNAQNEPETNNTKCSHYNYTDLFMLNAVSSVSPLLQH